MNIRREKRKGEWRGKETMTEKIDDDYNTENCLELLEHHF